MQIKDIMSDGTITVTPDTVAEEAYHKMHTKEVHHLIVVDGQTVVGVVSERDLGGKKGFSMCEGKVVRDFMSKDLLTATPDTSLQDAATLLAGYNIGCLPVVDEDDNLVGVVTISDLLQLVAQGTLSTTP